MVAGSEWSWLAEERRNKYSVSMAERNIFALQRGMKIKIFWQDFHGEKIQK